jgi:glycosyltransferase involved in cell wall biosynthesis
MLVRNEENRYLKRALDSLDKFVDSMLIIDDASTDRTPDICESYSKAKVIRLKEHGFDNEWKLRQFCWEEALKENPDWILVVDADEIFEDKTADKIKYLISDPNIEAWSFRLYDFWGSEEYYRSDDMWCAHNASHTFLVKNKPVDFEWTKTPVHCGRIPVSTYRTHVLGWSDLRIKHYGWANVSEHKAKFERYMKADGQGWYGNLRQYYSILDENPNLERWVEHE